MYLTFQILYISMCPCRISICGRVYATYAS